MKSIDVGGEFLQVPTDIFENGENRGTIIDSGTTLAYLPEAVYKPLLDKVNILFFIIKPLFWGRLYLYFSYIYIFFRFSPTIQI